MLRDELPGTLASSRDAFQRHIYYPEHTPALRDMPQKHCSIFGNCTVYANTQWLFASQLLISLSMAFKRSIDHTKSR